MIRGFVPDNGRLRLVDDALEQLDNVLWIDLVSPTNEEERVLESALGARHSDARGDGGDRGLEPPLLRRTAPRS